ncbi:ABC transporter ATP-binding protein [Ktedonosporobacter rubrisoli]|uniref:ABC transporter ATP-binding protein n=1 Tax=Ktedonosporobacter rubrisoli TaxID=2509675 RepID=A0A4P6JP88_KTERU|nr:ABC transporter ATP-binding protein [Ktedonosporobacter rubrisoli]QBD77189.1 ABC transporter ATP-binding protein [Ktedonosporobacter rubrisoli]
MTEYTNTKHHALRLSVQGVSKVYRVNRQELAVLRSIDLSVAAGEFVTIIGPSGCGKTTLLHIVAGLEEPDEGAVVIDGMEGAKRVGQVGYMLQQPLLLPWRTVEENVCLGLDIRREPHQQARRRARQYLEQFGLLDFAWHYPDALSGGMSQRVALLRTFLFHSSFLLLDEPFGALDALTRLSTELWLLNLWQEFKASILFITHDIREAIFLSDRIYVLSRRPAQVAYAIPVDLPRPRHPEHLASKNAVALEQELVAYLMKEAVS